ncbi:MFS transporter [Phaeacidiphilus oryzae]|uniref:MFS transporter n=1 Tax=Phaeacidiphilus oryzae TaxID=348818 RepID=UPI00055DF889|nr:MFS transporter [Phaeacidiphilus oryzae]
MLAEPRFRLLFLTRVLEVTAGSLRISTFSALVYAGTGSALLSALAFGAGFLPQALGSLLFGALADRLPPRALITCGYLLEGAASALIALTRMPVWAALGLIALVALGTPVFSGASGRLVARWLTGDAYVLGRSLSNMAGSGAQLFGLALGGAAVAALGPRAALAGGAAIHLLCAAAIRLRLPRIAVERRAAASGGTLRRSLRGNRELLGERPVRRLLLAQWLPSAFVAGAEGLITAYAGGRGLPAGSYAVLMACLPVGMLLGDLLVGRFVRPARRERLVVPLIALMGLPLLGFAAEPGRLLAAVLLLAAGFGFAHGLGLQREFLAALPEEGQGQAFGLLGSGMMTLQGLAPACVGALAPLTGTGGAMAVAGVGALGTAGWILAWRRR